MRCSEEVRAMVHAFDDKGRKRRVREIADEIALMERLLDLARPNGGDYGSILERYRQFCEVFEEYQSARTRRE